jgi:hypothetical protein
MLKKTCLKMFLASCTLLLFLLFTACGSNSGMPAPGASSNPTAKVTSTPIQTASTPTPTAISTTFAATVGTSGSPVNRDAHGDNLTSIHSAVDRPVAKFTSMLLNVPPRAKGVVYIQNDSANPQTLVSDTAYGFPTFTIAPYTTTSLVFHRVGTFKAHLKDYPVSSDTTITIIITMPSPD